MPRRTKAQWQALIAEQASSGLTAAEFCRRNEVNAKYFSLRKKQLSESTSPGEFIEINPPFVNRVRPASTAIKLRVTEVELPIYLDEQSDTLSLLLDRLLR